VTGGGIEWLIEARGCAAAPLRSSSTLSALCERAIRELDLHLVGAPAWHTFDGEGGVTGLYLLRESHLALHTFPEHGLATFNLYCCRPRPEWPWGERLSEALFASTVRVRSLER
jgi:S-adenosylmethionine decarboxylase